MLAVPRAAGAPCSRAGGARRIRGRGGSRRRMNAKLALLFGAGLLFPAAQPGASIYRARARPARPRRFLSHDVSRPTPKGGIANALVTLAYDGSNLNGPARFQGTPVTGTSSTLEGKRLRILRLPRLHGLSR